MRKKDRRKDQFATVSSFYVMHLCFFFRARLQTPGKEGPTDLYTDTPRPAKSLQMPRCVSLIDTYLQVVNT